MNDRKDKIEMLRAIFEPEMRDLGNNLSLKRTETGYKDLHVNMMYMGFILGYGVAQEAKG